MPWMANKPDARVPQVRWGNFSTMGATALQLSRNTLPSTVYFALVRRLGPSQDFLLFRPASSWHSGRSTTQAYCGHLSVLWE
mmetsp:Transcript_59034/g.95478  ORF Transcript_59034/g.95478 Transcript_59034/m.95478 type:complete len:82 (-) Transcript_59034:832-1077(-)